MEQNQPLPEGVQQAAEKLAWELTRIFPRIVYLDFYPDDVSNPGDVVVDVWEPQ